MEIFMLPLIMFGGMAMIGYILIGLGAWLILDELADKKELNNENLRGDGNHRARGDSDRKSSAGSETTHGAGGLTGGQHEGAQKFNNQIWDDEAGSSSGDHSGSEPDSTEPDSEAEPLTILDTEDKHVNQDDFKNGARDDGNDVPGESGDSQSPDGAATAPG